MRSYLASLILKMWLTHVSFYLSAMKQKIYTDVYFTSKVLEERKLEPLSNTSVARNSKHLLFACRARWADLSQSYGGKKSILLTESFILLLK